jgi:hypothetical protein
MKEGSLRQYRTATAGARTRPQARDLSLRLDRFHLEGVILTAAVFQAEGRACPDPAELHSPGRRLGKEQSAKYALNLALLATSAHVDQRKGRSFA